MLTTYTTKKAHSYTLPLASYTPKRCRLSQPTVHCTTYTSKRQKTDAAELSKILIGGALIAALMYGVGFFYMIALPY